MDAPKKPLLTPTRRIAISATLSVVLIAGKWVLSWLGNVEIVTTCILSFVVIFGYSVTAAAVNVFCLLDMVLYGLNPSVACSYFIYWNALALTAYAVKFLTKSKRLFPYLVVGLCMTLVFGFLTAFFDSVFYGYPYWARYITGIPFYAIHLASTLCFMLVGYLPLLKVGKMMGLL